MLTPILPLLRLAGPALALALGLLSGAFALQWHDLSNTRKTLTETQTTLKNTQATVARYAAISAEQKAQLEVNQAKVTELSKTVTAKVKTLKSKPVDNTLPAIAARGVSTAKEASKLWND